MRIKPIGVAEGDGGGTTAYSTDGVVLYTPTQAETNYTSFVLIAKKTGCIPASITVVPSESPTPGRVSLGMILGTALTETVGGYLAAAFKKLFDVATPVLTAASVNQSADNNTILASLDSRLTSSRAGYLDNLNVGGAVASQADINALNQSASRRVILTTVGQYERPESGSTVYTVEARTYSRDGVPMDATGTPTLAATGAMSGDLAANLGSVTNPATGVYRWAYTVANNATLEPIRFDFSAVVDGDTIPMAVYTQTTDAVAADFTTADRTKLEGIYNKLPSKNYLAGTANSDGDIELNESTGDFNATQQTRIQTQAAAALTDYDPPTRIEATADKDAVIAAIPTASQNAVATRDVNNTSPAANSLGAKVNTAAAGGGGGGTVSVSYSIPAAVARAALELSHVNAYRQATLRVTLTGLGDLTGRQKLWFTAKAARTLADTAAIFQVEETDGLTYLNGAVAADADLASLTVDDADAGDVTLVIYAEAMKTATPIEGLVWDVKQLLDSDPEDAEVVGEGTMDIVRGVTAATS